jgi:hypothetical protein
MKLTMKIAVILFIFLTSITECLAQATIIPRLQEVLVTRGGRNKFTVRISNREKTPLNFKASVVNMDVNDEGVPIPIFASQDSGIVSWVQLNVGEFTLQPDEAKVIEGIVKAPRDAKGGYGAIVYFSYDVEQKDSKRKVGGKEFSLELGRALSLTLIVTIMTSENNVDLVPDTLLFKAKLSPESKDLFADLRNIKDKNWGAEFPVKNLGNSVTMVRGDLSIWDASSNLVEKVPLLAGKGYMFPGKRRIFRAEGQKHIQDGAYLVRTNLQCREGKMYSGVYPISVLNGAVVTGEPSEAMKAMIAAAQPQFSMSLHYLDFDFEPLSIRTKGVTLINQKNDSLRIKTHFTDWQINDKGEAEILNNLKPNKISCSSWISIEPKEIIIPPKGKVSLKIILNTPSKIEGEYYSAVVFTPEGVPQNLPSELEMNRALFLAASSKKFVNFSAQIDTIIVKPVSSMMRVVSVKVENTGNKKCYAVGELTLLDKLGQYIGANTEFGSETDYIFPKSSRTFDIPVQKDLEPGKYRCHVTLKYAEKMTSLSNLTDFEEKKQKPAK